MSIFIELQGLATELLSGEDVPLSTVTRSIKRPLTKEQRAKDEPASIETTTFSVRVIHDTEMVTRGDGTFYNVTEALLDGEVKIGDVINIGGAAYTVAAVAPYNPAGLVPLYWEATLT